MRDLASNIKPVQSIAPAVQSATISGAGVDTRGFNSLAFVVSAGAIAGAGVFALTVEDSDDDVTYTAVPAAQLDGALPTSMTAATVYKVGYRGFKRFARPVLTKVSGTSIAASATAILSDAAQRPVT